MGLLFGGDHMAKANETRTQMVALLVGKSQDVSDDMWEVINRFTSAGFWIDNRFKYGDVSHTIIDNLVRLLGCAEKRDSKCQICPVLQKRLRTSHK